MEDTYQFLFCLVYSFAMMIEIFIPSYFGSLVYLKSEKLCYDIFKSNWMHASEKYKRSMRIFGERTLRPISIFAGNVFMLNLLTFLKVSWSWLFREIVSCTIPITTFRKKWDSFQLFYRILFQYIDKVSFFLDFEGGLFDLCYVEENTKVRSPNGVGSFNLRQIWRLSDF